MITTMDFDFKSCPWGDNLKSCAITVCDLDGVVLYQNKRSVEVNGDVRGRSMIPCHSARSREIIQRLINEGATNAYTIQKNGLKKMIYQTGQKIIWQIVFLLWNLQMNHSPLKRLMI